MTVEARTTAPHGRDRKLVPLMVSVCAAAPAVAEDGERLVMVGAGLTLVESIEFEAPPAGEALARTELEKSNKAIKLTVGKLLMGSKSGSSFSEAAPYVEEGNVSASQSCA